MYKIIKLEVCRDERGELIAVENSRNIPFDIKRVFFLFNLTQDAKRAQHANMKAGQLILCLDGNCEILLDDGKDKKVAIKLSRKDEAVYVEPAIWIEISGFSKDCMLLAMSEAYYDRKDQVHDYQEFAKIVQ